MSRAQREHAEALQALEQALAPLRAARGALHPRLAHPARAAELEGLQAQGQRAAAEARQGLATAAAELEARGEAAASELSETVLEGSVRLLAAASELLAEPLPRDPRTWSPWAERVGAALDRLAEALPALGRELRPLEEKVAAEAEAFEASVGALRAVGC